MNAALVAAILGAGGLGAIIAAIIGGLFSKRKLGAEATEIITKAAAGVVTNMQLEIDRQVRRNDTLVSEHRKEIRELTAEHEKQMQDVRDFLQLHVSWDLIVIAKVSELGIELPPAPPLMPPPSQRHSHR